MSRTPLCRTPTRAEVLALVREARQLMAAEGDSSRFDGEGARGDRGSSAGEARNSGPDSTAGRVTERPLSNPCN